MSAVFDHVGHHPRHSQIQGFAIAAGGLLAIGLALYAGVQSIGGRATSEHAWRVAAFLFLIPFVSDAVIRLFRGEAIEKLDDWAPQFELFFIAAYAGAWVTAFAPTMLAGDRVPSMTMAGSIAGFSLLLLMLVSSPKFFPTAGVIRTRIYDFASAGIWTIFTLSFLDRYVGPHPADFVLPTILLLLIGGVLLRFAASFQDRHPALFD